MKILYIQETPFSNFYFDPLSRRGVAIPESLNPVVLGMSQDFDPYGDCSPGNIIEYNVEPDVFSRLMDAGHRRNLQDAFEIISEHFTVPTSQYLWNEL